MTEDSFITAVLGNSVNRAILDRLPRLGLADAWLASGSLFQTAWNALTGRASDFGVKDYDVFYFDPDTSFQAEDTIVRHIAGEMSDLGARIEPRNQARVHLWFPQKFGVPYPPLRRSTDAIDRFLVRAAQVGVRPAGRGYKIYAPHGLDDIETMTIRPNDCPNFRADLYEDKAARWKAMWSELAVLPAVPGIDPGQIAQRSAQRLPAVTSKKQ